jgi:hypothetical protein
MRELFPKQKRHWYLTDRHGAIVRVPIERLEFVECLYRPTETRVLYLDPNTNAYYIWYESVPQVPVAWCLWEPVHLSWRDTPIWEFVGNDWREEEETMGAPVEPRVLESCVLWGTTAMAARLKRQPEYLEIHHHPEYGIAYVAVRSSRDDSLLVARADAPEIVARRLASPEMEWNPDCIDAIADYIETHG